MSLKDPTSKMSKSHSDERSRILLTDSSQDIYKKMNSALTDSEPGITYDPIRRPGVSNLIEILSYFDGRSCHELALEHEQTSLKTLKAHVAASVSSHLSGIREKYLALVDDKTGYLDSAAEMGAQAARDHTAATMTQVKEALGL